MWLRSSAVAAGTITFADSAIRRVTRYAERGLVAETKARVRAPEAVAGGED